jgi:hypothetical protein
MGDGSPTWTVRALIFSGRPDPCWEISPEEAERVLALWHRAATAESPPRDAPALGYRGCVLCSPAGETWTVFDGLVTGPQDDPRRDPEGAIENRLRSSAPPGTLPPYAFP